MLLQFRLFNGKMNAVYLKQVEYKYYGSWMKWKIKRKTKKSALSWEVAIHFKRAASICLRLSWHRIRYNRIETTSKSFVSSFKLIFSLPFYLYIYLSISFSLSLSFSISPSLSLSRNFLLFSLLLLSSSLSLLLLSVSVFSSTASSISVFFLYCSFYPCLLFSSSYAV